MRKKSNEKILGLVVLTATLLMSCGRDKKSKNAEIEAPESWAEVSAQLRPEAIDTCSNNAALASPNSDLSKIKSVCTCLVDSLFKRVDQDKVTALWNQEHVEDLNLYLNEQEKVLINDRRLMDSCTVAEKKTSTKAEKTKKKNVTEQTIDSPVPQVALPNVDGNWTYKHCSNYGETLAVHPDEESFLYIKKANMRLDFNFTGDRYKLTYTLYNYKFSCESEEYPEFIVSYEGTFELSKDRELINNNGRRFNANPVTYKVDSITVTNNSSSIQNQILCGSSNWNYGVARKFSGVSCGVTAIYDLLHLDSDGILRIGDRYHYYGDEAIVSMPNGFSAGKRPTNLSVYFMMDKQ